MTASICGGICAPVLLYCAFESSRSLSHLLMSFLFTIVTIIMMISINEAVVTMLQKQESEVVLFTFQQM